MSIFSERLALLRRGKNISQKDLGLELNVTQQAVAKWEKDLTEPDISMLKIIASFFGVSVDFLIGYDYKQQADKIYALTVAAQEVSNEAWTNAIPLTEGHVLAIKADTALRLRQALHSLFDTESSGIKSK